MPSRLFFDAHSTTPCDPAVVEAMLPYFTREFGNPASQQHAYGWEARDAVEAARQHVAALVGARLRDVVFTSGATEANNLAIGGVAAAAAAASVPPGRLDGVHVVTLVTEHPAVLEPCDAIEARGARVTRLAVQPDGLVDLNVLAAAVTPGTTLVSVMAANNEIGVLQPLPAIAAIARQAGAWLHTDASQAAAFSAVDMAAMGIDLLSYSAHKLYGPKGVGALVVRRASKVRLAPLHHGGGHERGLRSGTLNVPGIVGFGEAARLALERRTADDQRLRALRNRLWSRLREALPDIHLRGAEGPRLPHNLNVGFDGVTGRDLVVALTDVAVSPGAACASTSAAPSHVLMALGLTEIQARSSLRFGLLRTTTEAEVDAVADRVITVVRSLRR